MSAIIRNKAGAAIDATVKKVGVERAANAGERKRRVVERMDMDINAAAVTAMGAGRKARAI